MSLAPYAAAGSQTFNGVISGDGSVWQRGSASSILNGNNTYTNGTYTTAGGIGLGIDSTPTVGTVTSGPIGIGPLNISPENGSANGSGTVFASGGARTIANVLQYPTNNQVLIAGGTNALTFSGVYSLKGNDGLVTNRTFQVNNTNAWTTISGVIDDAASGCGFIKTGAGTLALNAIETYSGPTTVSAGTLAGSGTIPGSVLVTTNASIGGGAATGIGSLTIGGNLTLTNAGGFFRVNRAGSASDQVVVTGGITNTGIGTLTGNITVANLGATLQVGDTFTLFNKAVTGGSTLTVTGGGAAWNNKLAQNGTIQVIPPPSLTNTFNGTTLSLSWGASYLGWYLQFQTNALTKGLSTNWVTMAGSSAVTSTNLTVVTTTPAVFYRLSQTP
jgi:autotransporter-associated beta strand protein